MFDIYFSNVRKVFRSISSAGGGRQLLVNGQDFGYKITEVIVHVDSETSPGSFKLEEEEDGRVIMEITVPVSPEPIYLDGQGWDVTKESPIFITFPPGFNLVGRLMLEVVTEH